jgi:hypothetical protein
LLRSAPFVAWAARCGSPSPNQAARCRSYTATEVIARPRGAHMRRAWRSSASAVR